MLLLKHKGANRGSDPGEQSVGIQVPENRHGDLQEAIFDSMCRNTHTTWTYVTVSKTFDYLSKTFKEGSKQTNIRFIELYLPCGWYL